MRPQVLNGPLPQEGVVSPKYPDPLNKLSIFSCTLLDSIYLEGGNEGVKGLDGGGISVSTGNSVVCGGLSVYSLDGLEEIIGDFLLAVRLGKSTNGSTGLVHVTGEFVLNVEPLLLLNVCGVVIETILGLGKDGLLTGYVRGTIGSTSLFVVKTVLSCGLVNGVRRVDGSGLITSVSSSLRIRGSISDKSEDRETGGLSNSGVGSSRKEDGSGSSNLSENFTTGLGVYSGGDTGIAGL